MLFRSEVCRVNIMAQGLSTPDPSLNPTHLSMRRGRTTTTHYTHNQVSLMVSRNTTLVPSLRLRIGPACEAGLSAGMRRERVPPRIRKKEKNVQMCTFLWDMVCIYIDMKQLSSLWQQVETFSHLEFIFCRPRLFSIHQINHRLRIQ